MNNIITETNTPDLILNLIARQREENLSDAKFAAKLGISRPQWTLTRHYQREIQFSLLRGITRAYPGIFDLQIIAFLRDGKS